MIASVVFDDKEIKKFVSAIERKGPKLLETAVNKTTSFGLKKVTDTIPKRTGNLRGFYQQRKTGQLERLIFSKLKYAEGIESGFRAKTIRTKRKKALTIPIKKSVLTSETKQIKKASIDKLFRRLKKRKGKTSRQIMEEVGIVLAKKANIPRIRAQRNFERVITPATENRLRFNVIKAYRTLGFV